VTTVPLDPELESEAMALADLELPDESAADVPDETLAEYEASRDPAHQPPDRDEPQWDDEDDVPLGYDEPQPTLSPHGGRNASTEGAAMTADSQKVFERHVRLTPASTIKPRPVRWLWEARVALGTLALLAGREGIGKTTVAFDIAAQVTRGTLPGCYMGQPRAVIVAGTEDSWSHTVVPRLLAAGADLDKVFKVDVADPLGFDSEVMLPLDLAQLEEAVVSVGAAVILLDPLISRLSPSLDSHKDSEVRLALEPLVALGERSGASILGIIHLNKSGGTDALNQVMGSRAFSAVARAVLFAMASPDDEELKLLGQPKNNLGRSDLPTLAYRLVGRSTPTPEGDAWTAAVAWGGEAPTTITEALARSGDDAGERSATDEAVGWLDDFLTAAGGGAKSGTVKAAATAAGHSDRTLARARQRLRVTSESVGFPRETWWSLPAGGPS